MHKTKSLGEAIDARNTTPIDPNFQLPTLVMLWGLLNTLRNPEYDNPEAEIAQYACFKMAKDFEKLDSKQKKKTLQEANELIKDLRNFLDDVQKSL